MLQKIIALKNIGRFRNCAFSGDVTFRRVTLIFAENGRGKTTLCAMLRSLLTNQPALVLGRTTLGSAAPPAAHLVFASGHITFRNGAWSQAFPSLAIFDGQFVSDNVFAGDVVDTEHRRNLYRVIIGSQGVALAAGVNQLDADIRDSRARLQQYLPSGMTPRLIPQTRDKVSLRLPAANVSERVLRPAHNRS